MNAEHQPPTVLREVQHGLPWGIDTDVRADLEIPQAQPSVHNDIQTLSEAILSLKSAALANSTSFDLSVDADPAQAYYELTDTSLAADLLPDGTSGFTDLTGIKVGAAQSDNAGFLSSRVTISFLYGEYTERSINRGERVRPGAVRRVLTLYTDGRRQAEGEAPLVDSRVIDRAHTHEEGYEGQGKQRREASADEATTLLTTVNRLVQKNRK